MNDVPRAIADALPRHRDLYYGGEWHRPAGGYAETLDPSRAVSLGECAAADPGDVDAAARAAHAAFATWRSMAPRERAAVLRTMAARLREHADELALIDAANCGNPVREMVPDVHAAAAQLDYFAGLATELKGETIPMGEGVLDLTLREPFGVCARIGMRISRTASSCRRRSSPA